MTTKKIAALLLLAVLFIAARRPRGIEPLVHPSGGNVFPVDINNDGQILVGSGFGQGGFVKTGTEWTHINYPGSGLTEVASINDFGAVAGTHYFVFGNPGTLGPPHGFVYENGNYTQVDYPGANKTFLYGINNLGQIIGSADFSTPFLFTGGQFIPLVFPGGTQLVPRDIDNDGTIVGSVVTSAGQQGFLYRAGVWQIVDIGPPEVDVFYSVAAISGKWLVTVANVGRDIEDPFRYFAVNKNRTIPLELEPWDGITGINDAGDVVGFTREQVGFVSNVKALRTRG
jgi:uncharacterized membrane protein